jgi:hypothetical protein
MGTNYYWNAEVKTPLETISILDLDCGDPRIHIGKYSSIGMYCGTCEDTTSGTDTCPKCGGAAKLGGKFIWAQDRSRVLLACAAGSDKKIIIDEYSNELTSSEFLGKLKNCVQHDTSLLGQEFF